MDNCKLNNIQNGLLTLTFTLLVLSSRLLTMLCSRDFRFFLTAGLVRTKQHCFSFIENWIGQQIYLSNKDSQTTKGAMYLNLPTPLAPNKIAFLWKYIILGLLFQVSSREQLYETHYCLEIMIWLRRWTRISDNSPSPGLKTELQRQLDT